MANTNNLEFLGREGLKTLLDQVNKSRTHYEIPNAIAFEGQVELTGNSVKLNFPLLPNTEYQYYADIDGQGSDPCTETITTDKDGNVSNYSAVHDIGFSIKGDTLTWTSESGEGNFVKISGPTIKHLDPKYVSGYEKVSLTVTGGISYITDDPITFDPQELKILGEPYEYTDKYFKFAPGEYTYHGVTLTLTEAQDTLTFYDDEWDVPRNIQMYCDGVDPSLCFEGDIDEDAVITYTYYQVSPEFLPPQFVDNVGVSINEKGELTSPIIKQTRKTYNVHVDASNLDATSGYQFSVPQDMSGRSCKVTLSASFRDDGDVTNISGNPQNITMDEYVSADFTVEFTDVGENRSIDVTLFAETSTSMTLQPGNEIERFDFDISFEYVALTLQDVYARQFVSTKVNDQIGASGVPAFSKDGDQIVKYIKYTSNDDADSIVYRLKSTDANIDGRFNVRTATSSKHPVPKAQMDAALATKVTKNTSEESKQTVYITDPQGNQSYKKYTSEAYPSTIAHREASLDTIAVADPLYDAHPVTLRFANERYFPIQKKHTPQQGWVEVQELRAGGIFSQFGPLEVGKTYKVNDYVFVASEESSMDENGEVRTFGVPPEGIFQYEGETCPWTADLYGVITIQPCAHAPAGGYSVGTLYKLNNDLRPFATFTYQEVWDEESYMYEDFDVQFNKWVSNNLKHGQKVFTDLSVVGKFDTTNVITIVPDPNTADISKAANVICTSCSYYDTEGNPKVYPVSAAMYVQNPSGINGYIFFDQHGSGYWRYKNEMGSTTEYGETIYPDTQEDFSGAMVEHGATITFYDVADYTQHVTSSVMIQDPQGNPSNKPYTQFAEYGTIPMRSTSGSPTFEVGDPVNEQNPVTLKYARSHYEVQRGSSTGPNTVQDMLDADETKDYTWGGKYVRYYAGNGRFNVADPTGSLHPVNKRTMEKYVKTNRTHYYGYSSTVTDEITFESSSLKDELIGGYKFLQSWQTEDGCLHWGFKPGKYYINGNDWTNDGDIIYVTEDKTTSIKCSEGNIWFTESEDPYLNTDFDGAGWSIQYYERIAEKQLDAKFIPIDDSTLKINSSGKLRVDVTSIENTLKSYIESQLLNGSW